MRVKSNAGRRAILWRSGYKNPISNGRLPPRKQENWDMSHAEERVKLPSGFRSSKEAQNIEVISSPWNAKSGGVRRLTLTSKTSRRLSSNTEVGKSARLLKFARTTNF